MVDEVKRLMDGGGAVHMAGIGGVGMAGVALLLKARGLHVSGCDVTADGPFVAALRAAGIEVLAGHAPEHIAESKVTWVIRTSAVRKDSAEIVAAQAAGLPVRRRGEVLPVLLAADGLSVAVAGTHGKTTTATLITQILRAVGRDPSWCIGGESVPLGAVAHAGAGGVMVVEADESDGTLALYGPDIAVVTNVEFDHMEHFASVEDFEACFQTFMAAAKQRVVYCSDDRRARRLGGASAKGLSYGFSPETELRGELCEDGRTMRVYRKGTRQGELTLALPGTHNALNLLAATAVCMELGVAFAAVVAAAHTVMLPRRRYETIVEQDGIRVISDYAHHPTEITALVRMARREHAGRLLAVFQPHRYTRTAALGDDFPAAFAGVDLLVLVPVYAASETPVDGGTASDLYARFRSLAGGAIPLPRLATSLSQAWSFLRRELRTGDRLLVIGAGDVENIAGWARKEGHASSGGFDAAPVAGFPTLSDASVMRTDEPLGRRTTYGVGGRADCWVEAGSEEDAANVLRYCLRHEVPLRILGAGSNMLVSDLGVRGVVMRLTGVMFQGIRQEGDTVMAGGAVPLVRLQEWLTDAGLAGLEFLEGVPGAVGGIVRMNGGAYGHEVRERILWIRGLNRDGEPCIVQADALEWGYRGCEFLRDLVVMEAAFRLVPENSGAIRARRREISERRSWMNGLRCAGSVFRNPPGQYAGKLVEAAGLKGMQVGGAQIYPRHGNFVVAGEGACASDVLALIQRMESAVRRASGIELVREVVCLE